MTKTSTCICLFLVVLASGSCAKTYGIVGTMSAKKGTITVYRDPNDMNKCKTWTTPHFVAKKNGKATWNIVNEGTTCLEGNAAVEIRFDKGDADPLDFACVKKNKRKIECRVNQNAEEKRYKYSVWLESAQEDPEIQIEM